MFLKEETNPQQGCIYFMKYTVKTCSEMLLQIKIAVLIYFEM